MMASFPCCVPHRTTANEVARRDAPSFLCGIYGQRVWNTPLPRVFHTLVGIRPELRDSFLRALGWRVQRMGDLA